MMSRSMFRAAPSSLSSLRQSQRMSISNLVSTSFRSQSQSLRLPLSYRPTSAINASLRFYSNAQEPKSDADAASSKPDTSPSEVDQLKQQLESKNKELAVLKDQYLRQIADYQNLQTRTKREAQAAKDFALQSFVRDLIASVDNLEHALASVPAERLTPPQENAAVHADLVSLHKGLSMIEEVMLGTLKKHGVLRFDPSSEAEKFDPNRHEAVFHAPMPDKEDGSVFHTQQKGFTLNGRVLRAAQVGVVKNS